MRHAYPHLSVVIPAYNEERFLPVFLASLEKQQDAGAFEVIVVDNGSIDRTAQIARQWGVRVVHEPERGVCRARERGTEAAKGEIIVSTDADCVAPPHWLRNIREAFEATQQAIAVAGPFVFTAPPRWGVWGSKMVFRIVDRVWQKRQCVLYAPACNFAFRKDAWRAIGGYNINLAQGGDELDLLKRLQGRGRIIYLGTNEVRTSGRRLARGFFYTIFVTVFGFYLLDYLVASKLTGRSMFGHYPAFREFPVETQRRPALKPIAYLCGVFVTLVLGFFVRIGTFAPIAHAAGERLRDARAHVAMETRRLMHHLPYENFNAPRKLFRHNRQQLLNRLRSLHV